MLSTKIYISTILILLCIIFAGIYKFIFQGATTKSPDNRIIIHLTEDERHIVLSEMRNFLLSVQQISRGIADEDMELVSRAAKKSGNTIQRDMPGTLIGKLPIEFKQLGFDTHNRFDQISMDAESLSDRQHTLEQIAELMQNCIACHDTYQFTVENK